MPVKLASSFWLYSCSSRRMRTDSPTETAMRFFAGLKSLILCPPIIVRCDLNYLKRQLCHHAINHSILQTRPRGAIPLPFAMKGLVVKAFDHPKSGRTGNHG